MFLQQTPTVEYCEKATDFILKRPFYALGNIAFIIVSIIILKRGKFSNLSKYFGYGIMATGMFSFLYDASFSYIFQLLDLLMMHTFVAFLLYLNLSRLLKIQKSQLKLIIFFLVLFSFVLIVHFKGYSGNIFFAAYVLTVLYTTFLLLAKRVFTEARYLLISLGVFLLSFSFWCLDFLKIYCDPTNILNGRSIFHILTSVSIYYLFVFYSLQKTQE